MRKSSSVIKGTLCIAAPLLFLQHSLAAEPDLTEKSQVPLEIRSVPEGFRELAEPQVTFADIYYGDRYVLSAPVTYTPDTIRFSDPEGVVAVIRNISRPEAVRTALTGELFSNPSLVCASAKEQGCGVITPHVAGVIFNADRFRVDVFVAEEYLKTRKAVQSKYLPASNNPFGFVQGFSATASGVTGSDDNQSNYSLFGNSLLGWKESHLSSEWDITKDNNFSIDTLYYERDKNGLQYGGGYLDSSSLMNSEFSSGEKLLGVRAGSSTNSRLDTASVSSTPIRLFTNGPRRVEVIRDGRLIYATSVSAGSQEIDTRSFPDGAYNVTIRVFNGSSLENEYNRFYVKSVRLPPADEMLWFLEGGEATNRNGDKTIPETMSEWLLRGGLGFRIAESTALHLKSTLNSDEQTAETEIYHRGSGWDVATTAMVGNNSLKGMSFQSTGALGLVFFSYYYRRLWNDDYFTREQSEDDFELLGASFESHSLSASTQLFNGSLSSSYSSNETEGSEKQDVKSLSWFKTIGYFSDHDLELDLDYSESDDDRIVTVGLTLRRSTAKWNYSVEGERRSQKYADGTKEDTNQYRLDSRWFENDVMNGSGEFGLSYESLQDRDILGGDVIYDSFRVRADMSADYISPAIGSSYTSYTGRFDTSFAMNADSVGFGGGRTADSAVLIDIEGSGDTGFDVLVNGGNAGIAKGGDVSVVPLSPYGTYSVSIKPRGDNFYNYDQVEKTVTLYPGNVETLVFKSEEELVLLGKLVDGHGEALKSAYIRAEKITSVTDDNGIFQIRVPTGLMSFSVKDGDEEACTVDIPETYQKRAGVGLVGILECRIP